MTTCSRRQLLTRASALIALPLLTPIARRALAADLPRLDPDDAQARVLAYVQRSPNSDTVCANCQFYSGSANTAWGPCPLFPDHRVAAAGWCNAWIEHTG